MDEFKPRDYQVQLMEIGLKKNTIIYLPTGAGKTFIAVMILKRMSGALLKPYSEGGKISIILVNTISLVNQHADNIIEHTNLKVGQYSGDMKLDFWPKDKWYEEYDKYQVLVMTSQILFNNVTSNHIDLNKVNLIIFDECHRGVNDHTMRQLMKDFQNLTDPPRAIGLTASLLNGNCKPAKVLDQIKALEVTYHGKVATVDGLSAVIGYSTNPKEFFTVYHAHSPTEGERFAIGVLKKVINVICSFKFETRTEKPSLDLPGCKPLDYTKVTKRILTKMVHGAINHIESMGAFGGLQTAIAYIMQIERLKRKYIDQSQLALLKYIETSLVFVKQLLENILTKFPEEEAFKCSSDKILKLINIFDEFKWKCKEQMCCIVFTQQRVTAKVLYFLLKTLSKSNPKYSYIIPDYMVGVDHNPYDTSRENLYSFKKNKEVLNRFRNKEINLIIASNVLEEGVDIPMCTLVIKYDNLTDYRSYIQSKGRARHQQSLYYMLVESNNTNVFTKKYNEYLEVEKIINDFLIGKNDAREDPSSEEVEKMCREYELEPHYTQGQGSAHVTMATAIPLLAQYCCSLPSDIYTTYTPEWYEKNEKKIVNGHSCTSVIIMLPIVCPLTEPIEGEYMPNIKSAKRAAALQACKMLHEMKELDDHLLPRKRKIPESDINFLFPHYPVVAEPFAGHSKTRRLHKIPLSKYLISSSATNTYYIHILNLEPTFLRPSDMIDAIMYDSYTSKLCFGFLTLNHLPPLSSFPIFDTLGTVNVEIKINHNKIFLSDDDLIQVRKFHHRIFKDILKIKSVQFLLFDNSDAAEVVLLVPVEKEKGEISMDALKDEVKEVSKPNSETNLLEVSKESYSNKIVNPWHRLSPAYIVIDVCLDKDSLTPFPNNNYNSYAEYFEKTYKQHLTYPKLPLLFLKALTKRLNFITPTGREIKRKRNRNKLYEDSSIHLPPELVIRQDFPSSLWIQAKFLPTVLSRMVFMLRIEELRVKIAIEAGLGKEHVIRQPPLVLDESSLNYEAYIEKPKPPQENFDSEINLEAPLPLLDTSKKISATLLEAEFPWKDDEEPKDIERTFDVNIKDIEDFERFVRKKVDAETLLLRTETLNETKQSVKCGDTEFVQKSIRILEKSLTDEGPSLAELTRALTTANGKDIVNLERLETLGDSFLKWIASFYVFVRFPKYDEGKYTSLKGRLVSNKNLFYLARKQNLGGIMKYDELSPKNQWLPPSYAIPEGLLKKIEDKELPASILSSLCFDIEEQIFGKLNPETTRRIMEDAALIEQIDDSYGDKNCFLKYQYIGDKHVADVVESLLGAYLLSCGLSGAIKFVEWVGIIPKSENLEELLTKSPPNSVLNAKATPEDLKCHIPQWEDIESVIGYNFKDHSYLLQALTHSSYTLNRITLSYEKLEFLGDAILDLLITCFIYESCGNLNPGELTDLRSALVNNNTFASVVVRSGLHKHLLLMNFKLQSCIDRFSEYMKGKNYRIDDEVLILLNENELYLAEHVEVPKVLGDVLEALIGAIYLDCGKNLNIVWNVVYKIMWREIDLFSKNVPINVIRKVLETPNIEPKFGNPVATFNNKYIVPLRILMDGKYTFVHGCGINKTIARRAAAKLALRKLNV